MYFFGVVDSCLGGINKIPLSEDTLIAYKKLRYCIQIARDVIRYLEGVLMSAGFIIIVVGNWLTVVGWKFIPLVVNLSMSLVTVVVYLVIINLVPLVIRSHEQRKYMIKEWDNKYIERVNRTKVIERTRFKISVKLWRKSTKAQKPITVY